MEKLGLVSCQIHGHTYKKIGDENIEIPNYLERQCNVEALTQVSCGDVTYIWNGSRWAYLAIVIELFARKLGAWRMSLSPDITLISNALKIAYESRRRPKGGIFHRDHGSHYTSRKFCQTLWKCQIKHNLSRRGNCWANAPMECFFISMKIDWMPTYGY